MSSANPSAADRALALASGAATVALLVFIWRARQEPWPLDREVEILRSTGWLACSTLLLSLTMTPLGRLWLYLRAHLSDSKKRRMATFIAYRRSLGIVSAVAASIHAGIALQTYLWSSWAAVLDKPYLRSGLLALLILLALLMTSFPSVVRALGVRGWKELHRLAYVAAALVLHHLLLAPFASRTWTILFFAIVLIVAPLRALKVKRPKAAAGPSGE